MKPYLSNENCLSTVQGIAAYFVLLRFIPRITARSPTPVDNSTVVGVDNKTTYATLYLVIVSLVLAQK